MPMILRLLGAAFLMSLLSACAVRQAADSPPDSDEIATARWALASFDGEAQQPWLHLAFPGKRSTQFHPVRIDGRDALAVTADTSASMLRKRLRREPATLGRMRFSWKVPELIAQADMAERDADDAPVRVVLAFDGDRSGWSSRNTAMSEMARLLTGEEMPYATLMYVWCNHRAPGTVIVNPRTDRIRKLVVESGPRRLGQWLDYERDVRADFVQAFGEEPGPLVAVGVMSDTDNTRTRARAWYGALRMDAPALR